jgi:LuxR family transcriptional regulator, maltose regulon positive regulatory protein
VIKPALTRREHDVLRLIVRGLNNKQIARELGLSVHTTKHHVSRLFDRIDVASRLQAAIWYIAQGSQITPERS